MIRQLAVALCLAASPLTAYASCPFQAPFPTGPITPTPLTPKEGASVLLVAAGFLPPCIPEDCGPGGYFIQECDTVRWTFGDGTTQTTIGSDSTTHTYAQAGLYDIGLHISNALGSVDVKGSVYVASSPGTSIAAPRYVEVSEAAASVAVLLTRSGDLSRTNRVHWRLAAEPNVTTDAQGTISFAPGETEHELSFPIHSDGRYGDVYASFLYLDLLADGAVTDLPGFDALHMQPTIHVHDNSPIPVGTIRDVTVRKDDAVARVPVDLTGSFAFPCCRAYVDWRTIDGTARDGVDFDGPPINGFLFIQPDTTGTFIEIPLKSNRLEGTRSFDVLITYAPFPLARSRATVTIIDDSPRISPASTSAPLGTTIPFRVTVSRPLQSGDVIRLTSSNPEVVAIPHTVTGVAGASTVTFDAVAAREGSTAITVTDPRFDANTTAVVTVTAAPIVLRAEPARVNAAVGTDARLALSLSSPRNAPLAVALSSSDPAVVRVDPQAVIPPNGAATIVMHALAAGRATLTVTPAEGAAITIEIEVTSVRRRAR